MHTILQAAGDIVVAQCANSIRRILHGHACEYQRKRVVWAVLMKGVRVMYPHSVMWVHN